MNNIEEILQTKPGKKTKTAKDTQCKKNKKRMQRNSNPKKSKKIFYNFVTEEMEEADEILIPESPLIKKAPVAVVHRGLLALANEIRLNLEHYAGTN